MMYRFISTKIKTNLMGIAWRVRYKVFSFLGWIYRNIFYKRDYFLDTNFLITKDNDRKVMLDKLSVRFKRFLITSPIKDEIDALLLRKAFQPTKYKIKEVISFNYLYLMNRGICPVYHNFIATMHNPAQITAPDFLLQKIYSKISKGKSLSDQESRMHISIMTSIINETNSERDSNEKLKPEYIRVIENAYLKSIKKRKDGLRGKNKNYPNDIRNLSLIFIYALLNRKNITFVTSDSDAIPLYFDWISSITQQVTFMQHCLIKLGENNSKGLKDVVMGKKNPFFFDAHWMFKEIDGTIQKFHSNHLKYFSPRLNIKYWDKERQKFYSVGINVDSHLRDLLLMTHGPLNCPTARNDSMGAFLALRYWWPPSSIHNFKILKILAYVKPIYRHSQYIPPAIHDAICSYRKNDLSSNYENFSTFSN